MTDRPLEGRVALVTGASRAIGRGIATELGACGATTYITARTADDLDETARHIKDVGGHAVPIVCDHGDDDAAAAVFDEIARRESGLDILVNNASPDFSAMVGRRSWDIPFDEITRCLMIGPRSDYVASVLAARMMIPRRRGLIVNISSHGSEEFVLSVPYGAGKAAKDKIARDLADELREHAVAVVSLWPGLVKTERIMGLAIPTDDGRLEVAGLDLAIGESPRFPGRAIVALATDPDVMARSGGAYAASRLAREYGFTDVDGTLPPEVRTLAGYMGDAEIPGYWKLVEPFPPRQAKPATG